MMRVKMRSWHLVIVVALLIFGTVAASSVAGVWKTEGSRVPQRFRGGGDHESVAEAGFIRGRTTFAELLTWGLSREQIEEAIGDEMPARGALVRDFAVASDLEFGVLRTKLQELLDGSE